MNVQECNKLGYRERKYKVLEEERELSMLLLEELYILILFFRTVVLVNFISLML